MALRRLRLATARSISVPLSVLVSTLSLVTAGSAWAQTKPRPPGAQAPPGTKTDLELDPDAKPTPPPEPPPLPPPAADQWGVGGKDEEGKFAPPTKKKSEEEVAKEAEDAKKPVDLGPPRYASLDTVFGFGTMRDIVNDNAASVSGQTSTTAASFIFAFRWRFFDIWDIGLRFPFTRAGGSGPAGPYDSFASGNLELLVRPSFQLTPHLRLPAQVSMFLPIAQGDSFPDMAASDKNLSTFQAQINQAASYARGWEEVPLFATKRFSLRFGAGITYDKDAIHVTAGTKVDLMLKVGGGDAYPGFTLVSPTIAWVTGGSFSYAFLDGKVEPGLRAWLAYVKTPEHTDVTDYSGVQLVLEPGVSGRFPVNADKSLVAKAGLGLILPVSGPLGGTSEASIKGFRILAGFEF